MGSARNFSWLCNYVKIIFKHEFNNDYIELPFDNFVLMVFKGVSCLYFNNHFANFEQSYALLLWVKS